MDLINELNKYLCLDLSRMVIDYVLAIMHGEVMEELKTIKYRTHEIEELLLYEIRFEGLYNSNFIVCSGREYKTDSIKSRKKLLADIYQHDKYKNSIFIPDPKYTMYVRRMYVRPYIYDFDVNMLERRMSINSTLSDEILSGQHIKCEHQKEILK